MLRVLGLVLLAGCAPSEEELQAEFADYVEGANQCESAEECAVASADCPLGCWVVVRVDRVEDVERKARQLVDDYESFGRSCDYECVETPTPACIDEHCAAAPGS